MLMRAIARPEIPTRDCEHKICVPVFNFVTIRTDSRSITPIFYTSSGYTGRKRRESSLEIRDYA